MKKSIWLALILALLCLITLSSCDDEQTPNNHTHVFGEWTQTKKPTCIKEGVNERYCSCGEKQTQTIPASGHTEVVDAAISATCSIDGKTEGKHCSECNETLIPQTNLGKLIHTVVIDAAIPATCTTDGKTEGKHCSRCNETFVVQNIIPASHTDGEWIVDINATCTIDGSKHQECAVCSTSIKTEKISATGHTDGEWITDANATCTVDGSKHQVCSVCSTTIKTEPITATGHIDGEWITDANATCTEDGSKHQECAICKATLKSEVIPASHNYVTTLTKKDCSSNSKLTHICSFCDDTYDEAIPEINVSIANTSMFSSTTNGYGRFSKGYKINVNGGYGNIQATLKLYTSILAEKPTSTVTFSNRTLEYTLDYTGYSYTSDEYMIAIIIQDEAGNITTTLISLKDLSVISRTNPKSECIDLISENDIVYINTYGFGKYVCVKCNEVYYKDRNGDLLEVADLKLSKDGTTVMSCSNESTAELLIIPNSVTLFDNSSMFSYSNNLQYVLFGENYIDLDLSGSSIKHIYVPSNITVRLYNCDSLKTVIWGNGLEKIDKYGIYSGCVGRNLAYSSVESIVIPKSVTLVKSDVFQATTLLTTVFYMGDEEDWKAINIERDGNIHLTEANRYYYSETQPLENGVYWHYIDGIPTIW